MPSRPLLWLTVFFMLGISACRLFGEILPAQNYIYVLAVLLPASALLLSFRTPNCFDSASPALRISSRVLRSFVVPALLFTMLGLWAAKCAAPQTPKGLEPFLDGRSAVYAAEVTDATEYFPERTRTPLRLLWAIEGESRVALNAGILLNIEQKGRKGDGLFLVPGDRVLFRGVLKRFRSGRNPGGFDYVLYQAQKGYNGQCFLKDERLVVKLAAAPKSFPASVLNALRGRIELFRQKVLLWSQRTLDPAPSAFYAAMILGYKTLLDRQWQDNIHQTGLNHLLSVSGLHIGMLSIFVFWVFRLGVRYLHPSILAKISDKQLALWPALISAVFYAFLAGFGAPTIWRSVLTLCVFFMAAFRFRRADSTTMLALAALLILAADPDFLWQLPFQLTFACVLAIIVIYPKFRGLRLGRIFPILGHDRLPGRIFSHFEDVFWISIAINILLLPLIIFYFDGFALAGLAASVLLIPYTGFAILPLGLLSVFLFGISRALAYPIMLVLNPILWGCLRVIGWFAGFTWSYFWTGSIPVGRLVAIYAAIALVFAPISRKFKVAGLCALSLLLGGALVVGSYAAPNGAGNLRVDVIDVGQGSSALVRMPTGESMLVDGGGIPNESYDVGRGTVAPFLWHEGIRKIDTVVLSHDHPDHGLGLRFILSHFDVGSFWTSSVIDDSPKAIHSGLLDIAAKRNIKVRTFPDLSKDVQIGRVRVRLLHPTEDFIKRWSKKDLNEVSLALEISYGETRVILPGDIGSKEEELIIPALEDFPKTLLVAGHHGSKHSSSEEFLDALHPVAIIVSCGFDNQFGFPHPVVIKRSEKRNIPLYRTDLDGAVHAVSDGHGWTITTEVGRDGKAQKSQTR